MKFNEASYRIRRRLADLVFPEGSLGKMVESAILGGFLIAVAGLFRVMLDKAIKLTAEKGELKQGRKEDYRPQGVIDHTVEGE